MENYECDKSKDFLGKGTYADVYRAIHKPTGRIVALKKFKVPNKDYGLVPLTAVREVKAMRELPRSPPSSHLIELVDCFVHKGQLILVLEYMEGGDLEDIIRDRSVHLTEGDIKAYMHMLLSGLKEVHTLGMVHRDIKPNNLLLSADGAVKLSDFGLARFIGTPGLKYSPQAFADWFRPPEMLLGARKYTTAVDMWAAGCVLGELLLREPFFFVDMAGWTELRQMNRMFSIVGAPDDASWPGCSDLPLFVRPRPTGETPSVTQYVRGRTGSVYSDECVDLLSKLLTLDPSRRITAEQALSHPFFRRGVPKTAVSQLPRPRKKGRGGGGGAGMAADPLEFLGEGGLFGGAGGAGAGDKRRRGGDSVAEEGPSKRVRRRLDGGEAEGTGEGAGDAEPKRKLEL